MRPTTHDPAGRPAARELRLDRVLGRQVRSLNNRPVGRLEEFRGRKQGTGYLITDYVIGAAGLFERLGVGIGLVFGRGGGGYLAAWDQLDIGDPDHPRLTCPLKDLRRL